MKSLRQVLADANEAQLEQVAQLWSIGRAPDKGWNQFRLRLEQGMRDPISARFLWEHLGEDERRLLHNILGPSAHNWIVRENLPKKVQLPPAQYQNALDRLKRELIVFEVLARLQGNQLVDHRMGFYTYGNERKLPVQAADILYIPMEIATILYTTGREYFLPQSDRSQMTLEKILTPLYQSELDEMGHRYNMELNGAAYYSRTDYRSLLATSLIQPEAVWYAQQQLDETARNLFTLLCERGGKLGLKAIREFTGFDDVTLSTLLHTLAQYAIAFDTFSQQEHIVFVPVDMYKNLREAPARPSAITELITAPTQPQSVRPGEMMTLFDLATITGAVYQQEIEPTKSGTIPKRIATKIEPLLHGFPRLSFMREEENAYLEMLFNIAQELGLIQLSRPPAHDVKAHYEPGPGLEQWSHLDMLEQTRRLLQSWIGGTRWRDLVGANFEEWYSGYVDARIVRGSIITQLRACKPEIWYTLDSLVELIRGRDPFVLRPRQRAMTAMGYSKVTELRKYWDSCDKELIIGSFSSSLYELGMVALGYHRAGVLEAAELPNPDVFMLTELGARVLSSGAQLIAPLPATEPASIENGHRALVIQPSFELLLLQPDLPTLYGLLPFAQVNQLGMVSRLTLTRESFLRSMASGKSVEQVIQFLEERSQKGVPQNVAYTLHDWAKLYREATISQVILLEVTNEATANEICASPKLQTFDLRRLGPCAIAASGSVNIQELRRNLDKMGIVARISANSRTLSKNPLPRGKMTTGGRLR